MEHNRAAINKWPLLTHGNVVYKSNVTEESVFFSVFCVFLFWLILEYITYSHDFSLRGLPVSVISSLQPACHHLKEKQIAEKIFLKKIMIIEIKIR